MKKNLFLAKGLNISTANVAGNFYIYNEITKNFIQLNNVGGFIWNQINGLKTISDIINLSLIEYGVKPEFVNFGAK